MYKKSLITSIILTIINIFPTIFCGYLNLDIPTEGPESLALIVIIPFTLIIFPISLILLIVGLILSIKAIKSDSLKIKRTAIVFTIINILLALICVYIVIKFLPLLFM